MVCFLPSQTALCHSASKRGWLRGVLCSILEEKWLFLLPLHGGEVEMNRALAVRVLTLQEQSVTGSSNLQELCRTCPNISNTGKTYQCFVVACLKITLMEIN